MKEDLVAEERLAPLITSESSPCQVQYDKYNNANDCLFRKKSPSRYYTEKIGNF